MTPPERGEFRCHDRPGVGAMPVSAPSPSSRRLPDCSDAPSRTIADTARYRLATDEWVKA